MEDGHSGTNALEGLPAAYASWRASTRGLITERLELDLMLEMIGPASGQRGLDVGCGDGVPAVDLWKRGAAVTGLDASREMITAARSRTGREDAEIEFAVGAADALPLPAESFDAATAITVLCFLDDDTALRALREIGRVLRPGGRLVIGELGKWSVSGRLLRPCHQPDGTDRGRLREGRGRWHAGCTGSRRPHRATAGWIHLTVERRQWAPGLVACARHS